MSHYRGKKVKSDGKFNINLIVHRFMIMKEQVALQKQLELTRSRRRVALRRHLLRVAAALAHAHRRRRLQHRVHWVPVLARSGVLGLRAERGAPEALAHAEGDLVHALVLADHGVGHVVGAGGGAGIFTR